MADKSETKAKAKKATKKATKKAIKRTKAGRPSRAGATQAIKDSDAPVMGRPARAFEPETAADIVATSVRDGVPWRIAANKCGVNEQVAARWVMENNDFARSLKKAQADHVHALLTRMADAPSGQWQKWAWQLERMFPEQFGQNQRFQVETTQKLEISAAVCAQIAEGWDKFKGKTVDIG